jgi:hypothetical protein
MLNHHTALAHQCFNIAIAQRIAQILLHGAEDDIGLKVLPFEQEGIVHGRSSMSWARHRLAPCIK